MLLKKREAGREKGEWRTERVCLRGWGGGGDGSLSGVEVCLCGGGHLNNPTHNKCASLVIEKKTSSLLRHTSTRWRSRGEEARVTRCFSFPRVKSWHRPFPLLKSHLGPTSHCWGWGSITGSLLEHHTQYFYISIQYNNISAVYRQRLFSVQNFH